MCVACVDVCVCVACVDVCVCVVCVWMCVHACVHGTIDDGRISRNTRRIIYAL